MSDRRLDDPALRVALRAHRTARAEQDAVAQDDSCLDEELLAVVVEKRELDPAAREKVDDHLRRCSRCAGAVSMLTRSLGRTSAAPLAVPEDLLQRAEARARRWEEKLGELVHVPLRQGLSRVALAAEGDEGDLRCAMADLERGTQVAVDSGFEAEIRQAGSVVRVLIVGAEVLETIEAELRHKDEGEPLPAPEIRRPTPESAELTLGLVDELVGREALLLVTVDGEEREMALCFEEA